MFTKPPLHGPAGTGFTDDITKLRAGWLNYVGGIVPQALDAIGGGYYQFAGDIRLSSDTKQVKINSPGISYPTKLLGFVRIDVTDDVNYMTGLGSFTVAVPATFTAGVTMSGALTFSNTVQFDGAVTVNAPITHTSNGDVTWQSGCYITGDSGSSFTMVSGSAVSLAGTNTISGSTALSNVSSLTMASGSLTCTSGTLLITNSGSTTTINGSITVNSLAAFTKGISVTQSTSNTNAITATGNGTGAGATLTGGTTGPGCIAVPGTASVAAIPRCAGQFAGFIEITADDPSQGVVPPAGRHVIYGLSVAKAYCTVEVGTGGPYVKDDAHNVSIVDDVGTGNYAVTFSQPMPTAVYSISISSNFAGIGVSWNTKTGNGFRFTVYDTSTKLAVATVVTVDFQVFGRR